MKTRMPIILSLLMLLTATASGRAAAYSTPPSWNPMTMPGVTYNPATNELTANPVADPGYGVLGTNTKSTGSPGYPAPGIASFDPAAEWAVLNSTAFSRWIGWSDPKEGIAGQSILDQVRSVYGPGANVWIDCLAKSAGLNIYQAIGPLGIDPDTTFPIYPVIYPGIFGTAGSSTKWLWDGIMDHNTNAVPFSYLTTPNQNFSANYRIYIGDAAGNELLVDKNGNPVTSAATTTTWHWKGPAFVFTSQTGIPSGTVVESDVFTYTGTSSSSIAITGGEYATSTNGGASWSAWVTASSPVGTINTNDKVKIHQSSAAGPGVTTIATLAIPGVPGPGEFRITTTTLPLAAWPVKIQDGFDQPSLAYAYSIAPDMVEPNNAVIMIKDGILADETISFSADRNITVTLQGGYDPTFKTPSGITIIQGAQNVFTVKQGKVIVDKVCIQSTAPL